MEVKMKKILVLLVFLLIGVLMTTPLGCRSSSEPYYLEGSYSGSLWFIDDATGDNVTLEGNLQFLHEYVDNLPPPLPAPGSLQNFQPLIGQIKITVPTEEKTVRIRARSKLHKDDPSTANIYGDRFGDKDKLTSLYAADCKLNGKGKYYLGVGWSTRGALTHEASIYVGIKDKSTDEFKYLWSRYIEDDRVEVLFHYQIDYEPPPDEVPEGPGGSL